MANEGYVEGGDILLYYNSGTDVAPVWTPFAGSTSHKYSASLGMREISNKDLAGKKKRKPGTFEAPDITIDGMISYDGADWDLIYGLFSAKTKMLVKYSGRPSADTGKIEAVEVVGDKYLEGNGWFTSVSRDDANDANSTYSATISLETMPTIKTVVGV